MRRPTAALLPEAVWHTHAVLVHVGHHHACVRVTRHEFASRHCRADQGSSGGFNDKVLDTFLGVVIDKLLGGLVEGLENSPVVCVDEVTPPFARGLLRFRCGRVSDMCGMSASATLCGREECVV